MRRDEYPQPLRALITLEGLLGLGALLVVGTYYVALGHTPGKLVGAGLLIAGCLYGAALLWPHVKRSTRR